MSLRMEATSPACGKHLVTIVYLILSGIIVTARPGDEDEIIGCLQAEGAAYCVNFAVVIVARSPESHGNVSCVWRSLLFSMSRFQRIVNALRRAPVADILLVRSWWERVR